MPFKAKVTFKEAVLDSQEYGSTQEQMVSRVFFDLEVSGAKYPGLYAEVTQTPGSNFEEYPLAVGAPQGYNGPFNADEFRSAVERYFRKLIGKSGMMVSTKRATNLRMQNVKMAVPDVAEFDINR